jgi:cytochrome c peroxidase
MCGAYERAACTHASRSRCSRHWGWQRRRTYFQRAFGDRAITLGRVASALADHERTRMSGNSAWDRWERGDARALSPSARRGLDLFTGDAQCSRCHYGPNFTDGAFHNLGVGWDAASQRYADEGRGAITGRPGDRGAFKTPTLRDAARSWTVRPRRFQNNRRCRSPSFFTIRQPRV